MVVQITVTGMVLGAMPVSDYDKRLVILTKERGKITVFAKGARRQNSALLACTQPFSFGEFTVYEGKTAYNLVSANITNYFIELRDEFEAVTYGMYFLEFAEYLSVENANETSLLKLLYQTLRALGKKTIPYELIRCIFELKIVTINGETPQVFECVECSGVEGCYQFRPESGGLLCEDCARKYRDFIRIDGSTVYTMQYIITSTIEKLYTFHVTKEVLAELQLCMKHYLKTFVGREFKSLEMLKL